MGQIWKQSEFAQFPLPELCNMAHLTANLYMHAQFVPRLKRPCIFLKSHIQLSPNTLCQLFIKTTIFPLLGCSTSPTFSITCAVQSLSTPPGDPQCILLCSSLCPDRLILGLHPLGLLARQFLDGCGQWEMERENLKEKGRGQCTDSLPLVIQQQLHSKAGDPRGWPLDSSNTCPSWPLQVCGVNSFSLKLISQCFSTFFVGSHRLSHPSL